MEWIWLGVIVSLVLIELISLNLTSIWFVISGIISYILLRCNQDYTVQVAVFLIVGILLLLIVRHRIKDKVFYFRDKQINKAIAKHPFLRKFIPSDVTTIKIKYNSSKQKKKRSKK